MAVPIFNYTSCFIHHVRIYKIFGFWKPDKDMKWKSLYNLYTCMCVVIWVLFLLSQILYMITNRANVDEITATLYVTVTFGVNLIKMITIYNNMDYLKASLSNSNGPVFKVKTIKQYVIAKNAKKLGNRYFYLCLYFGSQTDLFFACIPIFLEERTTFAKGWFPFDWRISPYYELTYFFQAFAFVLNTFICLNLDSFYASMAIQVGLQCDLLGDTLSHLEDFYADNGLLYRQNKATKFLLKADAEKYSREMTKNLIVCIYHHKTILE